MYRTHTLFRVVALAAALSLVAACSSDIGDEKSDLPAGVADTGGADPGAGGGTDPGEGGDPGEAAVDPGSAGDPGTGGTDPGPAAEGVTGDTGGGTDTTVAPQGLGAPCQTSADCGGTEDDYCFSGFCTRRCQNDEGPLPGACNNVAKDNPWAETWGCPLDLIVCLPGYEEALVSQCGTDAACGRVGEGFVCAGLIGTGTANTDGVCLPAGERRPAGEPCMSEADCQNLLCMGNDPAAGTAGRCSAHCNNAAVCPEGNLCVGIGLITQEGSTIPGAWAGVCVPVSGSRTQCGKQATCLEGEYCEAFVHPTNLKAQHFCIDADGEKEVGAECDSNSECISGRCLLGGIENGPEHGFCGQPCPGGVDDCAEGMACAQLTYHDRGTPEETGDDPLFGLCVFDGDGDPCIVSTDWCAEGYVCEVVEGGPEGLGSCVEKVAGSCTTAEECDDEIACTTDTCGEDGMCAHTTDDAACDDEIACTTDTCDATEGCKHATDDTACADDGVECTTEACVAGEGCVSTPDDTACADDGFACTTEACDSTEGCKSTPDNSVCDDNDLCTGDVCDTAAEGAGANGCVHDAVDCDDGDPCTIDDCLPNTGCSHDPEICDDGFDCTTDACDPTEGCSNTPDDSACADDGVECTTEKCADGEGCKSIPDNNLCTADEHDCTTAVCDTTSGCVQEPDNNECADGDLCTTDVCDPASGCSNPALDCDDGFDCTTDDCDSATGCTYVTDDNACTDDGFACTTEACVEGEGCVATPDDTACAADEVECTNAVCDPDQGCTQVPDDTLCDDGHECTTDSCDATGGCTSTPDDGLCDDQDDCTQDMCDPTQGCVHTPIDPCPE